MYTIRVILLLMTGNYTKLHVWMRKEILSRLYHSNNSEISSPSLRLSKGVRRILIPWTSPINLLRTRSYIFGLEFFCLPSTRALTSLGLWGWGWWDAHCPASRAEKVHGFNKSANDVCNTPPGSHPNWCPNCRAWGPQRTQHPHLFCDPTSAWSSF